MGGGAVMRVAGKIFGVFNGSFRGGFPAFPENLTSAASSTVNKPLIEFQDSLEVASSCDVGQPLPRLVFGGPPTLEEAQDAIFQLRIALDQVYLSNESSEGSGESDMGHDKLAISDSVHLAGKACVTKALAPKHAIQAFRLLKESADVQTVIASIVSDQNMWTAVMKNEALLEYLQSQDTGMNGSLDKSPADTEIPGYQSHRYSGDEKEPKWRTPTTSDSSKRTKLSNSRAYSSEGNNETPTNENEVESPVRPIDTKAAKMKGKGKAKTEEAAEAYESERSSACRKLDLMEALNDTRRRELEAKQSEMDLKVILADTSIMNEAQRKAHAKLLEKIMARN